MKSFYIYLYNCLYLSIYIYIGGYRHDETCLDTVDGSRKPTWRLRVSDIFTFAVLICGDLKMLLV